MSRVFDMYNFEDLLGNSMQSVCRTIPRTAQIFFANHQPTAEQNRAAWQIAMLPCKI